MCQKLSLHYSDFHKHKREGRGRTNTAECGILFPGMNCSILFLRLHFRVQSIKLAFFILKCVKDIHGRAAISNRKWWSHVPWAPFHAIVLAQPSVPQNSPEGESAPRRSCVVTWFLGVFVTWCSFLCEFVSSLASCLSGTEVQGPYGVVAPHLTSLILLTSPSPPG